MTRRTSYGSIALLAFVAALALAWACWGDEPANAQTTTVYVHPQQPPQLAGQLWPPAPFSIWGAVQPIARQAAVAEFGHLGAGVDVGAVRAVGDRLEIAWPGGVWVPWTGDYAQMVAARAYFRYGLGWSRGHHADPHAAGQGMYEELSALDPVRWPPLVKMDAVPRGPRPLDDVSYDLGFLARVRADYAAMQGTPLPTPTPRSSPSPTPRPSPTPVATPTPCPTCQPVVCPTCPPPPTCATCKPRCLAFDSGEGLTMRRIREGRQPSLERLQALVRAIDARSGCWLREVVR